MQQFDLLNNSSGERIQLKGAELVYWPSLFAEDEVELFEALMKQVAWQSETIKIVGVERLVPRLTAWYGDKEAHYRYSGVDHNPMEWVQVLKNLRTKIESVTGVQFNSALCNLYRNGQDSVAWHSDDEVELGVNPVIASVSFGAPRSFQLKHKNHPKLRHKMSLTSGSLLLMKGSTQSHWQHQVPKEPMVTESRINITFRKIIKSV